MSEFYQVGTELGNQYDDDRVLRAYLRRRLPPAMLAEIEPGLRRLGERAATDLLSLDRAAEATPPRHVPYDSWGRRVDRIEVSEAWKQFDRISAQEGMVAVAYERQHGWLSRLHQFARLHLFGPSSAVYTCPLAMTDGAARVLELYGDDWLKANPLRRLISRDPALFWTSGQWMTERTGGSDVSGTSTVARVDGGHYRLYGDKWFASAITSQMALTLARLVGAPDGNRGLSLFYLELRDQEGRWQNICVHRLKDKLGTRALPTAELSLEGTPARMVGGEGQGVRKIAALLNITRAYNAGCAVGFIRRCLALARDYARKRRAFGRPLAELPLHVETLAALQVEYEAAFHLVFHLAGLMGKAELDEATAGEQAVLRLLTPLAKLYTAKQAIAVASEMLEAFGGAGYVEEGGLPRLLRDVQVLSIWEGTTNVLSLDALRAVEKEAAFQPFIADLRARLDSVRTPLLDPAVARAREAAAQIEAFLGLASRRNDAGDFSQAGMRALAYSLARTYTASLLLEHADWQLRVEHDRRGLAAAQRWCAQDLAPLLDTHEGHRKDSRALAMDEVLLEQAHEEVTA